MIYASMYVIGYITLQCKKKEYGAFKQKLIPFPVHTRFGSSLTSSCFTQGESALLSHPIDTDTDHHVCHSTAISQNFTGMLKLKTKCRRICVNIMTVVEKIDIKIDITCIEELLFCSTHLYLDCYAFEVINKHSSNTD